MTLPRFLVFAIGLALAAPASAQTPKRGGMFNFAITAETPTYDCHATDTFAAIHFLAPFYSTLLQFNLDDFPKVKGDLAETWAVSADQLTFSFKLRRDVLFHDGSALTSADVKATYERLRKPLQGVVSARQATFTDIDTIETPDAQTIVFKLKAVNPRRVAREDEQLGPHHGVEFVVHPALIDGVDEVFRRAPKRGHFAAPPSGVGDAMLGQRALELGRVRPGDSGHAVRGDDLGVVAAG